MELMRRITIAPQVDATGPMDLKVTAQIHGCLSRSFSVTRNGLKTAIGYACGECEWWEREDLYSAADKYKAYSRAYEAFSSVMAEERINPLGDNSALRPWVLLEPEMLQNLIPGSPSQVGLNAYVTSSGGYAFHTLSKQVSWSKPLAPHFRACMRLARRSHGQDPLPPESEERAYQDWISKFTEILPQLGFEI